MDYETLAWAAWLKLKQDATRAHTCPTLANRFNNMQHLQYAMQQGSEQSVSHATRSNTMQHFNGMSNKLQQGSEQSVSHATRSNKDQNNQ